MEPTGSSKHFTVKPAARPPGTGASAIRQASLGGLAGGRRARVRRERWRGRQRACRRRFARGGACGWLRLQCRRLRDGAQAARFARARPDGRPAGALRPRRGAGSRLVSHTTRPERAKEDPMNRWTGTGHLTKDPKFLETESGTAICTLRIAVKRAGKQGHDGYFDVKCFDAPGARLRAVPQGRARGRDRRPPAVRRVPDPGRRLRLAGLHRRRARRVPRQPQAAPTVRPAPRRRPNSPPPTARRASPTRPPDHHRGPAAQHRPRARRLPP